MKVIKYKPYWLFFGLILIILGIGFLMPKEDLSFNFYDTYYVISKRDLAILLSFLYALLAMVYYVFIKLNFDLVNWMTTTHVLISILGLFLVFLLPYLMIDIKPQNFIKQIDDITFNNHILFSVFLIMVVMVAAQVLFFANLIYTLIKDRIYGFF